MPSVLLDWVANLSYMQQSVLIAAVRAPDGIPKNHPVKVLMRWYRRCVLLSAFEGRAFSDPYEAGGGSFTGPFTEKHLQEFNTTLDGMRQRYLEYVDELPHHFQLHLMHAVEILGYKHPSPIWREWWRTFYAMIVNDAHLFPETEAQMDARLGDTEVGWRAREVITAR